MSRFRPHSRPISRPLLRPLLRQRLQAQAFLALLSTAAAIVPAHAQQVVLRAKNGDFEFSGKLQSSSTAGFILETLSGDVTLDATQFECTGQGCPAAKTPDVTNERLAIHGSSTIGDKLMPTLIRSYIATLGAQAENATGEKRNEVRIRVRNAQKSEIANIDIQHYGSQTAFTDLAKGDTHIGMSSRTINDAEIRSLAPLLGSERIVQHEHVIGLDGLIFVVAPGNPVTSLTIDQIARIFAGQITDWQQLGQAPGAINAYAADAGSGSFDLFKEQILKPRNLVPGAYVRRLDANTEIARAVAADSRGIGMTSLAASSAAQPVAIAGSCGLVTQASAFTIKTEDYPLSRRLYLYTAGPLKGAFAQGLLKFALSAPAQTVVTDTHFVDQRIDSQSFAAEAERFKARALATPADQLIERQLLADVGNARRLSIAYRFASGSSEFQSKARQDVVRLAELLQTPDFQKKLVTLIGFTDETGSPVANTRLAQRRAEQVRAAVLAAAGPGKLNPRQIVAHGFGPLSPVACNDTLQGQQLNRRVEVWARDLSPTAETSDPAEAFRSRQPQQAAAQPATKQPRR